MNQQSPAGSVGAQSSAKRKRGRPRKEDVPAPPEKLIPHRAPAINLDPLNVPHYGSGLAPLPASATSSISGDINDLQVGQAVTGILEGTFDAGYLLCVEVGEGRPPLRGLVFKPGKFIPVTPENDVAPSVKMHPRMSISEVAPPTDKIEVEETVIEETVVVCESSVVQDMVKEVCKEQDDQCEEGQGSSEKTEKREVVETRYEGGGTGPMLELSLCSSFETPVVAVEPPAAGEKEKSITVEIQQENHQEQPPGVFMDVGQAQETSFENVLEGEHNDVVVPFSGNADVSEPGAEKPKTDETVLSESIQPPNDALTASVEPVPPPEAIGADLVEPVLPPEATLSEPVPPPPENNKVASPELAQEQEGGQAASAEHITSEHVEEKGPEESGGMVGSI